MMTMNLVIQEKRKELGLTQEQVAEYLNVSAPAVSKWEKGITCPDIALLPSLARLLQTDLNTLFCFHEDLTQKEMSCFCKEIADIVQKDGLAAAFEAAAQKIHEYPHNEELLHCCTLQLEGLLTMSRLLPDEIQPFEDTLVSWYRRLAESSDIKIRNSANYMLASKYIRQGEYDSAQATLDLIPDHNDVFGSMEDKLLLQVMIYQDQGKAEKAAEDLERALLTTLDRVQMLLYKLVDAELAAGENHMAKLIAEKTAQMVETFDLRAYNSLVAPLQIAITEKNKEKCIQTLRSILETMLVPWEMGKSPFFYRIAKGTNGITMEQMMPAILTEMESDPGYAFLQNCDEYKALIDEYREKCKAG